MMTNTYNGTLPKSFFTIYLDESSLWRWRKRDYHNRLIIGSSHKGFSTRQECEANASFFGYNQIDVFVDFYFLARDKRRFNIYQTDDGKEWRWTVVSLPGGNVLGKSSEGYRNKHDCLENMKRMGFSNVEALLLKL